MGHLRVTDALYRGLPPEASPFLLGSQDKTITVIYRIVNVYSITRAIFTWLEQGSTEKITTPLYRWYLRSHTNIIYRLKMNDRPYVDVIFSPYDKVVIELYENLYKNTTIS